MPAPSAGAGRRLLASVGPAAVVLLVGGVGYGGLARLRESRRWVAHSRDVVDRAQRVVADLTDAETGQRGYLLTGEAPYLEPYRRGVAALRADTAALRALTRDDVAQQRRLDTLGRLAARRVALLDSIAALRRAAGFDAAAVEFRRGVGKALMDSARAVLGALEAHERRRLDQRTAADDRRTALAVWALLGGTLLAGGLALLTNALLARAAARAAEDARALAAQHERLQAHAAALEAQQAELEAQARDLEEQQAALEEHAAALETANAALRGARAEAEAAAARLRATFAHAATGMALADLDGRLLDVNAAFCLITGYAREELLGTRGTGAPESGAGAAPRDAAPAPPPPDLLTLTHPDDRGAKQRHLARLLAGVVPSFVHEKRYVRKDGQAVWVRNSVSLLRDGAGRPEHVIAVVEDITAEHEAGEALRERHAELQHANAQLQEQAAELEIQMETLQEQAVELEARTEALEAQAVRLAQESAAREAARAEAEEANRAKSQFLATMSHELRTPLNAVTGYADLLELGLRGPMNDAQRQDLRRIKRSGQVLLSLINDILNFAKLEAAQVAFDVGEVEVDAVLSDVSALTAPQFAARGIDFHCACHRGCGDTADPQDAAARADPADAGGAGLTVWADREKLQQVLLNLLTNAVKFTEPGGAVRLTCETADAHVLFRVQDTGRGIAADQLARIFDPFVQVDRHLTHTSQQGVGLGLTISRDLARRMGGDLTVESSVGAGSVFTLRLPRGAPGPDEPAREGVPDTARMR